MNVTLKTAQKIIPASLQGHPVFLRVDDTMVPKSGKSFEQVSILYDHAAHGGSSYLNGHCFVSLMLNIPVWKKERLFISPSLWGIKCGIKQNPSFL